MRSLHGNVGYRTLDVRSRNRDIGIRLKQFLLGLRKRDRKRERRLDSDQGTKKSEERP